MNERLTADQRFERYLQFLSVFYFLPILVGLWLGDWGIATALGIGIAISERLHFFDPIHERVMHHIRATDWED